MASQIDGADLEWWMHFNIPKTNLHAYFSEDVEKKASLLPRSKAFPDEDPGTGLFTKVKRKKGDLICSFPGYWMEAHAYNHWEGKGADGTYAFNVPSDDPDWAPISMMVYIAYSSQGNYINAATLNNEVQCQHTHLLQRIM
jgi:hypothetical protein